MKKLLTEWRKYLAEAKFVDVATDIASAPKDEQDFLKEKKRLEKLHGADKVHVQYLFDQADNSKLHWINPSDTRLGKRPANQKYKDLNTCKIGPSHKEECMWWFLTYPAEQPKASPLALASPVEPQKGPEAEIAKIKEELSKLKMPAGSVEMASLSDKSHARSPKITFKESLAGYILLTSRAVLVNCVSKKCKGHPLFGGKFSDKAAMATPLGKKCKQICIKDNSKLQLWAKSLLFGPKCKKLADRVVLHRGEIIAFSDMKSVQQHLLPCMDSMVMAGLNRRSRKGLSWQRYHVLIKALKKQRQPRRAGVERWWDISGLDGFGLPVGSEQLLTGLKVRRWYRKGLRVKRKQWKLKRRLRELEKSRQ